MRQVKTTDLVANEEQFEYREYKEVPQNLEDEEVVATQTDLYLTINLTENLQKA